MSNHQKMIDEITHKISTRESMYKSFLVKSFIHKHKPSWKNIVTKIVPLSSLDTRDHQKKLDYADFALVEEVVSLSNVLKMIEVPEKSSQTIVIGGYEVEFENEYWSKVYTYDSGEGPFDVDWYCEVYRLGGPTLNIGHEALVAVDLPVFPDRRKVIKDFVGIDVDHFSDAKGIILCLPNYGARIKELNIGSTELKIEIEENTEKSDNIVGKVYCEKDQEVKKGDVNFINKFGSINIGFKPDYLYFALISRMNADILDRRQFGKDWDLQKGVVVDIPHYQLKELIKNGETDTVEFKADVGKPEDFAETVVAFANGRGGIIIVGVDDNSNVVGLGNRDYKDIITKILRSRIEPPPNFRFDERKIDEKRLIILLIEEGRDKPYILRDKGPYVRAGATDRIATRYELDEFYAQRQTGFEAGY